MQLIVNGEERQVEDTPTLGEFLALCALPSKMVVVERNGEIVPRENFVTVILTDGDVLEIVQMMAGG